MTRRMRLSALLTLTLVAGCMTGEKKKETKLTFEELPVSVRLGIEQAYPDARVREVTKRVYTEQGVVQYKVKLTTKDGEKQDATFAPDGEKLVKD